MTTQAFRLDLNLPDFLKQICRFHSGEGKEGLLFERKINPTTFVYKPLQFVIWNRNPLSPINWIEISTKMNAISQLSLIHI